MYGAVAVTIVVATALAGGVRASAASGPGGVISTVAGGVGGPGPATSVSLGRMCGISVDAGNLYTAGIGAVRQISEATGQLTTPAGDFVQDPYWTNPGIGGLATKAPIGGCATTHDAAGNLLITDEFQERIWAVPARTGTFYGQKMTAGHIYDIVGDGGAGCGVSGVVARSAPLYNVDSIVTDQDGNLVIDDSGAPSLCPSLVQVVATKTGTFYGQKMTAGYLYTLTGSGPGVSGDGGPASKAGIGADAGQVQFDHTGNLVIADGPANRIRVIAEKTGTFYGQKMTAGDIYSVAGTGAAGFSGDGGPALKAALNDPLGVTVDQAGNLVAADTGNNRIRVVAAKTGTFYGVQMTAGHIYTVAGGSPATKLSQPVAVAIDSTGGILAGELGGDLVVMLAEKAGTFYGQTMTTGHLYTVAGNGSISFSGDGGPADRAQFYQDEDVATDSAGDILVNDAGNERIRVIAARTGTLFGRAMTKGDIYTVAGNGQTGFAGDGGPATAAEFNDVDSIVADQAGNIVICDAGNYRIRVVAATTGTFYGVRVTAGHIYTIAGHGAEGDSGNGGPATGAGFWLPGHLAVDSHGNVLVPDDETVRVVAAKTGTFYGVAMKAGNIYDVAGQTGVTGYSGDGGPALEATFFIVGGVAVDAHGNLVIADYGNDRVRVVAAATGTFYGQAMKAGDVYTIAGDGSPVYGGNGQPALKAGVRPNDLAVDATGNIVLGDEQNRIRVIAETSGTFYGIAMTAGRIYTVVNAKGHQGYTGDGGPAAVAETYFGGLTLDPAGNLLISDHSGRIRQITN